MRIFEKSNAASVILAERVGDGQMRGVIDVTQYPAGAVLTSHVTKRLWEAQPMRWFEGQITLRRQKGQVIEVWEYCEVRFKSYLPRRMRLFWGRVQSN